MNCVKIKRIKMLIVSTLIAMAAGCVSLFFTASGAKVSAETPKVALTVGEDAYSLDFKLKDGASVRLAEDSGLRFSTLIKKTDYEALTEKYGEERETRHDSACYGKRGKIKRNHA